MYLLNPKNFNKVTGRGPYHRGEMETVAAFTFARSVHGFSLLSADHKSSRTAVELDQPTTNDLFKNKKVN